ncbi:MAG: hypothetical protein HY043_21450 [Verrucomicrobia bacterium]|nr:hypothetical protein [Verrucomicrobiota bacterium]
MTGFDCGIPSALCRGVGEGGTVGFTATGVEVAAGLGKDSRLRGVLTTVDGVFAGSSFGFTTAVGDSGEEAFTVDTRSSTRF